MNPDEQYMEQLKAECHSEWIKEQRRLFWKAMRLAFVNRCHGCDWSINRVQRWLYTTKAIICMVFGLKYDPEKHGDYPDEIEVVVVEYHKLYAGWESETLQVGWRHWFYRIEHDSDWWM